MHGGLNLWFKEKWQNQREEVGYKNKPDVYRPTVRVTKDTHTPATVNGLAKTGIAKARKEKAKTM